MEAARRVSTRQISSTGNVSVEALFTRQSEHALLLSSRLTFVGGSVASEKKNYPLVTLKSSGAIFLDRDYHHACDTAERRTQRQLHWKF